MTTRSCLLALLFTTASASLLATETPASPNATSAAATPPKLQVSLPSYDARIRALLDVAPTGFAPETVVTAPQQLAVPAELRATTNSPDSASHASHSAPTASAASQVASL